MKQYELTDRREIIKSNNLIESSYKLTVAEHRLLYLAATKLNTRILERNLTIEEVKNLIESARFELIEISVTDYMKEFDVKSRELYKVLEDVAKKLFERKIIYQTNEGSVVEKRWVITCVYDKNKSCIKLQFHPDLIEDLLLLKNKFTILQFEFAKQLKSQYSYRLYELFRQYSNFKMRKFGIEELRFLLGIGDDEYKLYSNFKNRVIMPAVKEVNEYTDIEIDFEEIKDKKKVSALKFYIKPQIPKIAYVNKQLSFIEEEMALDVEKETIYAKLQELLGFEITSGQAETIFYKAFDKIKELGLNINVFEFIKQKKDIVDTYNDANNVNNYIGALISAIEENWETKKIVTHPKNYFNSYGGQRRYDIKELEKMLLSRTQNKDDM